MIVTRFGKCLWILLSCIGNPSIMMTLQSVSVRVSFLFFPVMAQSDLGRSTVLGIEAPVKLGELRRVERRAPSLGTGTSGELINGQ